MNVISLIYVIGAVADVNPANLDLYKVLSLINPFIIFFLGFYLTKKVNSIIGNKVKILFQEIQEIRADLLKVESSVMKHLGDDDFRQSFRNSIKRVVEKNTETPLLKQVYKNILAYYASSLSEYAFNYYYYPEKKKETVREREKFLIREKNIMLDDFHKYLDSNIEDIKPFKGKKLSFSAFIIENRLHNPLELMIMELIKNGLEPIEIKSMFSDTLDKFCESFITATLVWEDIKELEQQSHNYD